MMHAFIEGFMRPELWSALGGILAVILILSVMFGFAMLCGKVIYKILEAL